MSARITCCEEKRDGERERGGGEGERREQDGKIPQVLSPLRAKWGARLGKSPVRTFVRSFVRSFVRILVCSFFHSFVRLVVRPFIYPFVNVRNVRIPMYVHSSVCSFRPFVYPSVRPGRSDRPLFFAPSRV